LYYRIQKKRKKRNHRFEDYDCHSPLQRANLKEAVSKAPCGVLVIAGLTRNPLKNNARFSGDPASSAG
jgi:hypothetical protein